MLVFSLGSPRHGEDRVEAVFYSSRPEVMTINLSKGVICQSRILVLVGPSYTSNIHEFIKYSSSEYIFGI